MLSGDMAGAVINELASSGTGRLKVEATQLGSL